MSAALIRELQEETPHNLIAIYTIQTITILSQQKKRDINYNLNSFLFLHLITLAWEKTRHLATLPLVSPPNDVWETSAEIPYWWRVTSQIWVMMRHQNEISAIVSQTSFGGETCGSVAKSVSAVFSG